MYIIKGLLNIIVGILICFVKSPFDNEVLNICVSLLFPSLEVCTMNV